MNDGQIFSMNEGELSRGGGGTGSEVLNRKKKMQLGYCEECISQTNAKSNNLFVKKLKSVISFYDSYQIF